MKESSGLQPLKVETILMQDGSLYLNALELELQKVITDIIKSGTKGKRKITFQVSLDPQFDSKSGKATGLVTIEATVDSSLPKKGGTLFVGQRDAHGKIIVNTVCNNEPNQLTVFDIKTAEGGSE